MGERIHKLKTVAQVWEAIASGEKTFEIRLNDRCFQRGDIVELVKLQPGSTLQLEYDGPGFSAEPKTLRRRIGWMLQGGQFGLEPRYCAFTLEPVDTLPTEIPHYETI